MRIPWYLCRCWSQRAKNNQKTTGRAVRQKCRTNCHMWTRVWRPCVSVSLFFSLFVCLYISVWNLSIIMKRFHEESGMGILTQEQLTVRRSPFHIDRPRWLNLNVCPISLPLERARLTPWAVLGREIENKWGGEFWEFSQIITADPSQINPAYRF